MELAQVRVYTYVYTGIPKGHAVTSQIAHCPSQAAKAKSLWATTANPGSTARAGRRTVRVLRAVHCLAPMGRESASTWPRISWSVSRMRERVLYALVIIQSNKQLGWIHSLIVNVIFSI